MSERQDHGREFGATAGADDLDAWFAEARSAPPATLPDALMRRLMADAAAAAPTPAKLWAKPSAWSRLWDSLQDIFGGKQGVAGAAFAGCAAFAFGVMAPDMATNMIGLDGGLDLAAMETAALQSGADPSVLWDEE